eukprot:290634-Chlamydomonas_euryale.AAC.1
MVSGQWRLGAITNSSTWPPPRSILSPPLTCWGVKGLRERWWGALSVGRGMCVDGAVGLVAILDPLGCEGPARKGERY